MQLRDKDINHTYICDMHINHTYICDIHINHTRIYSADFLLGLVDKGVKSIARIGGRCKVEALKKYNVRELSQDAKYKFDSAERRYYAKLMSALDEGKDSIKQLCQVLKKAHIGPSSWDEVSKHIRDGTDEDIQIYSLLNTKRFMALNDNGWRVVVDGGKELQEDYLWKRWLANKDPGRHFRHKIKAKAKFSAFNPWTLTPHERQQLTARWEKEMFCVDRDVCARELEDYDNLRDERQQLTQRSWSKVLQSKRVIGCTTNGAAKYKDILKAAKASVIIIEEAGEVLEAHVLSSLQPTTKHLILIGDHKQLRPKLEHYPLSVEAHSHLEFNVSLFERLIKSDLKHGTLEVLFYAGFILFE